MIPKKRKAVLMFSLRAMCRFVRIHHGHQTWLIALIAADAVIHVATGNLLLCGQSIIL